MFAYLALAVVAAINAFSDRLRGGGFFTLAGDSQCRAVWGGSLMFSFMICVISGISAQYWSSPAFLTIWALWIFAGGWIGETIPHGFCSNMGRRGASWFNISFKRRWPGIWIPEPTQADFSTASPDLIYVCDLLGMATIGALRAALVVLPSIVWGAYTGNHEALVHAQYVIEVRAVLQAAAYAIGWEVPFTFGRSLRAHSTEWGESFDGLFWVFGFAVM